MINWGNFTGFFSTGIPSIILYPSLFVMIGVILIGLLSKQVKNIIRFTLWVLLVEYLFVVALSTVICRVTPLFTYAKLELTPFWTYWAVIEHVPGVSVWDIVLNVVLFLPLGFLVKLLYPFLSVGKMFLIAFICSFCIELNQYIFEKGIAQVDDVIHNLIGSLIGWWVAKGILVFASNKTHKS